MGEGKPFVPQVVFTCQLIILSLATGVAAFGIYVICFPPRTDDPPNKVLVWTMSVLGLAIAIVRAIVPRIVTAQFRSRLRAGIWRYPVGQGGIEPKTAEEKLALVFQTQMLVGAALLEGAAFANLIAFMLEGQLVSLLLAIAFFVGLLLDFPTLRSVTVWIERQKKLMHEEQMLERKG